MRRYNIITMLQMLYCFLDSGIVSWLPTIFIDYRWSSINIENLIQIKFKYIYFLNNIFVIYIFSFFSRFTILIF